MSEELMQIVPVPVGKYLYYPTRDTNLEQLRKAGVINKKIKNGLANKKLDGVIVFPKGKVMAGIEYKQPDELNTNKKIAKAIEQERLAAKSVCKLLIVTDNTKTFWVNTLNGEYVCDSKGLPLSRVLNVQWFQDGSMTPEDVASFEELLENIDASLSEKNNNISTPTLLDPTPLARSLWQRIWVSTGKEPEKCLYNVVELFVFKFLSDLGVLGSHLKFEAIINISKSSGEEAALELYAGLSRPEIRKLFPPGEDGTTIINGTIFVNEKGQPNLAQAQLFGTVLEILDKYGKDVGSFRNIQREFKTRLYESFLRQSAGTKALGQYFTPRNVVQAMVRMSDAASLKKDARIGDPFCGVGGFLLETIVEIKGILQQFAPKGGKVSPAITIMGFDKGSDEKDDERTIILAKANMLIYFSDLIAKHHSSSVLKEFSEKAFNKVFRLLRSNLGTFAESMEKPFDLILTNPPYVTSGVASLRKEIESVKAIKNRFTFKGRGTESLAIEWIVRNLAEGGQALVVVPDGLLSQTDVLRGITKECLIQAIISLPARTFYSTPKKTYILVVKRKADADPQTDPAFAYLVSEIGETRDTYRFPIDQNDLVEATQLFRQFKGSPSTFQSTSPRFKPFPVHNLLSAKNWLVDRLWTESEKAALGIVEATDEISGDDFVALAKDAREAIEGLAKLVPGATGMPAKVAFLNLGEHFKAGKRKETAWMEYVTTKTGWTKTKYRALEEEYKKLVSAKPKTKVVPCKVYSAAKSPVATVADKHPGKIDASPKAPILSFAANGDGSAGTNFEFHTEPFYVSNDRTCIRVVTPDIDPEYVLYALHGMKEAHGFSHAFKATKENLGVVSIGVPLTKAGKFDLARQKKMVAEFKAVFGAKAELQSQLDMLLKSRLAFGR